MNNFKPFCRIIRRDLPITRWGAALLLLTGFILFVTSCSPRKESKPGNVDYYTCSMHPSVHLLDPDAKCPICGMNLIPVLKKGQTNQSTMDQAGHEHARMLAEPAAGQRDQIAATNADSSYRSMQEFAIPMERQQSIGVTYAVATNKPLQRTIRTVGTVAYDKQHHWDFVARVDGYVQKLYVSSRGEVVDKGQPLLSIYSPDLLTTQQELLDLLRMRDQAQKSGSQTTFASSERLIASAERRLQLWNITTNQIVEIEKSRQPCEALMLYSPFKGVVQDLVVDQGRRVSMGDHLVDVADLSSVWVWAEFYQDDIPLLKTGQPVTVTSASLPGETFSGRISVVDPFVNEATRTARVRLQIENTKMKLRPDMYVNAELAVDLGEGLTVPVTAIMPTGQRNIVFVDKGEGKLEPRQVELGGKFNSDYLVKAGLKDGDRVVNSANFLIDAEAKVQGALKSW